jgi:hypothetical protein
MHSDRSRRTELGLCCRITSVLSSEYPRLQKESPKSGSSAFTGVIVQVKAALLRSQSEVRTMTEGFSPSEPETPEAHRKAEVIKAVCADLTDGNVDQAEAILKDKYPFVPITNVGRSYSRTESLSVFYRDGFVDRYSGLRLVFPGALRILSVVYPTPFRITGMAKQTNAILRFGSSSQLSITLFPYRGVVKMMRPTG